MEDNVITRKTNGGGRAKLTLERVAAVLAAVRKGHSRRFAAARAGISHVTLFAWLHEGASALVRRDNEEQLDERDTALAEFVVAYNCALADRADPRFDELETTDSNARVTACTYLLSLVSREDYSPKQSHEVTGRDGGAIEHEHKHEVDAGALCDRIEALAARHASVAAESVAEGSAREAEQG